MQPKLKLFNYFGMHGGKFTQVIKIDASNRTAAVFGPPAGDGSSSSGGADGREQLKEVEFTSITVLGTD